MLSNIAEEIAARGTWAGFVSAIIGGVLVALLSFRLQAVNSVGSRIAMAYLVGFVLAVGPFDHVIVTVLHLFFGILFGAAVDLVAFVRVLAVATAGNLVGRVGIVTLSHVTLRLPARSLGI